MGTSPPPKRDRRVPLGDPYDTDRTTQVTCVVDGEDVREVLDYTFTSDVLSLGDPCGVTIGDPHGKYIGLLAVGKTFELYMADPNVSGGQKTRRLKGRVIRRQAAVTKDRGAIITLGAADLGWHLQSTPGPLWYKTKGKTWDLLLTDLVMDPTLGWGFAGVRADNLNSRKLNQGRAGIQATTNQQYKAITPPFQIEPGETIASKIITYAKRERRLLNVSPDGYLQIWTPDYSQEIAASFYLSDDDKQRSKNNIESAMLDESIDGKYSQVTCVGQIVNIAKTNPDSYNANAGKTRGTYEPATPPINFSRHHTFSDGDQVTKDLCVARAQWVYERGLFDSWTYTIEVKGHHQNGLFYASDTMVYVKDDVSGVDDALYVASVTYKRTRDKGTRTTLVLKKPNLLAA
jgi:prophage tail gpP-like protein